MKYLIVLNGCDDATYCELELNDKELELLVKISKEINKYSEYICQPTISIYKDYIKNESDNRYIVYKYNHKTKDYWKAIDLVGSDKK